MGRLVLDAVSNFVRGNTDAAIASGDTTISVADASIFPDPATDGEFNVVIWDVNNFPRPDQDGDVEIMRVTERDTTADELTVTRAQEITSASAHPEGSAIHLSPTAKMFTDIEDTFTTEAEAADAAPVQSVFGRVGTVVAETGDYAATQISNFSSEVLTSISGSTIAPSEITDLWNGTVVTADVNNTNTTTETLEAELVSTEETRTESLGANTDDIFILDRIVRENEPSGDTISLFDFLADKEDIIGRLASQHTNSVGTEATTIYSNFDGNIVLVADEGDWADLVLYQSGEDVDVIGSSGTSVDRTYTLDSNELQLALSSGETPIGCIALRTTGRENV